MDVKIISQPNVSKLIPTQDDPARGYEYYPAAGRLDLTQFKKALLYAYVDAGTPAAYVIVIKSFLWDGTQACPDIELNVAPGAATRVIDLTRLTVSDGPASGAAVLQPSLQLECIADGVIPDIGEHVHLFLHLTRE